MHYVSPFLPDVFLSYCWASDGSPEDNAGSSGAVPALHAALEAAGVTTFWDQRCLNAGEPLVGGFTVALTGSTLVVPVVSQFLLDRIRDNAATQQDNVLLGEQLSIRAALWALACMYCLGEIGRVGLCQ